MTADPLTPTQQQMLRHAWYFRTLDCWLLPEQTPELSRSAAADVAEELVALGLVAYQTDMLSPAGEALRLSLI